LKLNFKQPKMKYFLYTIVLIAFFSCAKKEKIENLDPYYSFYTNNTMDWNSVLGDTIFYEFFDYSASAMYIPNVFTPNNNGYNDKLVAQGFNISYYSIFIFNSEGEIVYSINDTCRKEKPLYTLEILKDTIYDSIAKIKRPYLNFSKPINIPPALIRWDGKSNGKDCPEGFYNVKIHVISISRVEEKHEMKVYLLRDFKNLPKDLSSMTLSEELDPRLGKIYVSYEKKLMQQESLVK